MQVENEDQSRVIGAFADRYKWQVFNLACVYADETETEHKTVYLIISPYLSDEFKMRIEAMCAHIQAEYDVLLRSKSQLNNISNAFQISHSYILKAILINPCIKRGIYLA